MTQVLRRIPLMYNVVTNMKVKTRSIISIMQDSSCMTLDNKDLCVTIFRVLHSIYKCLVIISYLMAQFTFMVVTIISLLRNVHSKLTAILKSVMWIQCSTQDMLMHRPCSKIDSLSSQVDKSIQKCIHFPEPLISHKMSAMIQKSTNGSKFKPYLIFQCWVLPLIIAQLL